MRIQEVWTFVAPLAAYEPKWFQRMLSVLCESFGSVSRGINGGLGFGDGVDIDNMVGKWITYTTNGVANTEDTIVHDMGVVPIGFLVMIPPESGTINKGTTAWTASNIYLKCSAASQTAKLFLLIPSQQTDG